jgi:hypothetical protein
MVEPVSAQVKVGAIYRVVILMLMGLEFFTDY